MLSGDSNLMDVGTDICSVSYSFKKLTKQDKVLKNINRSLIVFTTIENVNTMALVDSGSSFRMISINFVNKLNIVFNRNISGFVILAASDNVCSCFDTIKFPLSSIYGDNDKNLIHTSHSFKILPFRHLNFVPVIDKKIIDDMADPNKAPFDTPEQQAHSHNAVKPFADQNTLIPKNPFFTIPESVKRLDTIG